MGFIYKKNNSDDIEVGRDENSFILQVKNPGVEDLLEIYSDYFSGDADENDSKLPVDVMKRVRDLIVNNATGWKGIKDENGSEISFTSALLLEILNSDIDLFQTAINGAMEKFFTHDRDSEKN